MGRKTHGSVITGDIVGSRQMSLKQKDKVLKKISVIVKDFTPKGSNIDEYRGDSFQIITDNTFIALRLCISLRAYLISEGSDVRLSLASSTIDRWPTKQLQAEGAALILSGHGLDAISSSDTRFVVQLKKEEYISEFDIYSLVIDDIMGHWTPRQAEAIYYLLQTKKYRSQVDVAAQMSVSQQSVSKFITGAKWDILKVIIERYQHVIDFNGIN